MNPRISIIVPVYKVEAYLNKCIDSILNQTFEDFELILVNDGSPDKCGEICEDYAKKDSRIRVFHKENGGQATARNFGIDIARGEYIGFVDSDDYIEPEMYEVLYNMCINDNCDMVNCSSKIYFNNKIKVNGNGEKVIHSKKEAMRVVIEGLLYDECLWSKLIKKSVLKDLRMPVGIVYEDTAFVYKIVDKCERIGYIGVPMYNYIKREDSTMDRAVKEVKTDAILVYKEMYEFVKNKYPDVSDIVRIKLSNTCISIMNTIIKQDEFNIHINKYREVSKVLNKNFYSNIKSKNYHRNEKILLLANKINPMLYKKLILMTQSRG